MLQAARRRAAQFDNVSGTSKATPPRADYPSGMGNSKIHANESRGANLPPFDFMYRAITARDTRFDGQFYTAVKTTGIYCRPSCPANKPQAKNVVFYETAAGAQTAGFRACQRCVPDATPGSPLWNVRATVAHRAMRLIEDGVVDRDGVQKLAGRLGYTARHLNRITTAQFGASPLALARAHRAQTAHKLLTETDVQITQVGYLSGFSSIRQFNDVVRRVFSLTPSEIRARSNYAPREPTVSGEISLSLPYREPFNFAHLLQFYSARAVEGVEFVDADSYTRSLALPHGPALATVRNEAGNVQLTLRYAHLRDLPAAVSRVRRMLDLDADPVAVDQALGADSIMARSVQQFPGLRLPGSADPHETLFRAIVGQHLTVKGATGALAQLATGMPGLGFDGPVNRLFPSAAFIATIGHELIHSSGSTNETLRLAGEELSARPGVIDFAEDQVRLVETLLSFEGVGPWCAAYVAMRVLGAPDILPPDDAEVRAGTRQLGFPGHPEEAAERFHPWRSYFTLHAWRAAAEHAVSPSNTVADSRQSKDAGHSRVDV